MRCKLLLQGYAMFVCFMQQRSFLSNCSVHVENYLKLMFVCKEEYLMSNTVEFLPGYFFK